jgi:hypothetical protein
MSNRDSGLLQTCISGETKVLFQDFTATHPNCDFPLDSDAVGKLTALHTAIKDADEYAIFRHPAETDELWRMLIGKAIKCLRYFDEREPFKNNANKKPQVYGLDELYGYYQKYKEFERMLYGSSQYYRDHVVHVLRTWLSGIRCLVRNNGAYLNCISIHDDKEVYLEITEKISIWTLISLTHDLGYPLEKAKDIMEKTHSMVRTFVTNPDMSMDLSFHGVQNYMNDFIVRLMSSKMIDNSICDADGNISEEKYVARLQPKYYFKFQKSLERTKHGIVSTLIIYKLLTYFLESDYNINEDYSFNADDRRQFYIRREILRAIASHTCTDVYHMYMGSFAFLLIIADDMQEWGRKYITELYVPTTIKHEQSDIDTTVSDEGHPHVCKLTERVKVDGNDGWKAVVAMLNRLREQALVYVTIFRDGQETVKRDFDFVREYTVVYEAAEAVTFKMTLKISNQSAATFSGEIDYASESQNKEFGKDFIKELEHKTKAKTIWKVFDISDTEITPPNNNSAAKWKKGIIEIDLNNTI